VLKFDTSVDEFLSPLQINVAELKLACRIKL